MQRTRLSTLISATGDRLNRWASQPWRRISILIIFVLGGFLTANVISVTAGQSAAWDVSVAFICLTLAELVSWLNYRFRPRFLWVEMLNAAKLGFMYGLFLDAFKLGS
ncbi:MAG: DUF565 domain-containing protein [Pseudanabaenaceae cyanobacterium]